MDDHLAARSLGRFGAVGLREDVRAMMKLKQLIDLSQPVYDACPRFPAAPEISIRPWRTFAEHGTNAEVIHGMSPHIGTHIDAPVHKIEGGASLDDFPLRQFMGEGIVIDVSWNGAGDVISVEDLERANPRIQEDDIVCLYTGWDKTRGVSDTYHNAFPYLHEDGAEWLARRKVRAVGVDVLSLEEPGRRGYPTHHAVLSKNIWIIEDLANLDKLLHRERWYFCFLPLYLSGLSAAPCRAVALEFEDGQGER